MRYLIEIEGSGTGTFHTRSFRDAVFFYFAALYGVNEWKDENINVFLKAETEKGKWKIIFSRYPVRLLEIKKLRDTTVLRNLTFLLTWQCGTG